MKPIFEDIDIVHQGVTPCPSYVADFSTTIKTPNVHTVVYWENSMGTFKLSNGNTHVIKMSDSGWYGSRLVSKNALKSKISYFQAKIITVSETGENEGGIIFGITQDSSNQIIMINIDTGQSDCSFFAGVDDVLGVVVDLNEDHVRFYKNKKFMGIDKEKKPSDVTPMHAFLELYYKGCEIHSGNYYPYRELEPYQ
jgi:hypothetical protein